MLLVVDAVRLPVDGAILDGLDPRVSREVAEHRHLLDHNAEHVALLQLGRAHITSERLVHEFAEPRLEAGAAGRVLEGPVDDQHAL